MGAVSVRYFMRGERAQRTSPNPACSTGSLQERDRSTVGRNRAVTGNAENELCARRWGHLKLHGSFLRCRWLPEQPNGKEGQNRACGNNAGRDRNTRYSFGDLIQRRAGCWLRPAERGRLRILPKFLKRNSHIGHVLASALRVLAQAAQNQLRQIVRETRGQRLRLIVQHCRYRRHRRIGVERAPPRRHLIEHRAERKDITPGVHNLAFGLLRRHERRSAHHYAGLRFRH